MQILYIDESGTADPLTNPVKMGCSNKFIVGGILIDSKHVQELERKFYLLKEKYLIDPLTELKYNTKKEDIKIGFDKEKLRSGVFEFIRDCEIPFKIITLALDKQKFAEKSYMKQTKDEIYSSAFQFLLERVNLELNAIDDCCLVILDSRDKKDNKTLYYSYVHLLQNGTQYQCPEKFSHLLPSIAFSDSAFCLNLCVADFCCASVFQLEEHSHPLYFNTIKNKFRNNNGKIEGYGIAKFP